MHRVSRYVSGLTAVALVWAALLSLPAFTAAGQAQSPNLLVNGGMDGKYVMQCSARGSADWVSTPCGDPIDFGTTFLWQTVQVPVGWAGWWQPPNVDRNDPNYYDRFPSFCDPEAPRHCIVWHNPEFRDTAGGPQAPSRKVAGDNSQKYFTFYSLHEAGLYQIVGGIQPDTRLRFSVYMQAWSTASNDAFESLGQPTMGMKVGIDPFGGSNPWSTNIVWSGVQEAFDHWELFTVEAVAKSTQVTVFTRSYPHFALQHNDVYVDEASLVVVSSASRSTATRSIAAPAAPAARTQPARWSAGMPVVVANTGGQRLRLRAEPRTTAATVSRVSADAQLVIATGPRVVGGQVWWMVREPQSTVWGWAAQTFLRGPGDTPTGTPRATTPAATGTPKASATPALARTPQATPTPRTLAVAAPNEYVVQPGESLVSIATKFGLLSIDLIELNPQLKPPRYYVYSGQVIKIRP